MNRKEYDSDICKLYEGFIAMSERSEGKHAKKSSNHAENTSDASLITKSEKHILLDRIACQMGVSQASKLPYVAGLIKA